MYEKLKDNQKNTDTLAAILEMNIKPISGEGFPFGSIARRCKEFPAGSYFKDSFLKSVIENKETDQVP